MIDINNYDIHLKPLQLEDIELVRMWRNSKHVRSNMIYTKIISSQQQLSWFEGLNSNQHYYIITTKDIKIGLIDVKNIDWQLKTGEAGIFIGDLQYTESPIALNAILALMDHYFIELELTSLKAKVLKKNTTALFMNQKLGYQITHEDTTCFHLKVSPEDYKKATKKFRNVLSK